MHILPSIAFTTPSIAWLKLWRALFEVKESFIHRILVRKALVASYRQFVCVCDLPWKPDPCHPLHLLHARLALRYPRIAINSVTVRWKMSLQKSLDKDIYVEKHWCALLYKSNQGNGLRSMQLVTLFHKQLVDWKHFLCSYWCSIICQEYNVPGGYDMNLKMRLYRFCVLEERYSSDT